MQICNFFADSKRRAQELSIDVSFVVFGHQTWDLEGGGVSRDRVNVRNSETPGLIYLKFRLENSVEPQECSQFEFKVPSRVS